MQYFSFKSLKGPGWPLSMLLLLLVITVDAERIYIRHKRSLERENVPASESTVVVRAPNDTANADLPKDIENEISGGEAGDKDCKDFLEFDYNPLNDSMWFNGRIPSLFHDHHNRGISSFEQMFHRMLSQASQMFNRFPVHSTMANGNKYPDNYNGTVEEEVTINGQRFKKRQHVINKTSGGSKISIMSTVYEPVDDSSTLNPGDQSSAGSSPTSSSNSPTTTVGGDLTDGKIINYK